MPILMCKVHHCLINDCSQLTPAVTPIVVGPKVEFIPARQVPVNWERRIAYGFAIVAAAWLYFAYAGH